ncbi:MAG: hypothetical protein D6755_00545, partial [Anaerolineae bacterium]
HAAADGAQVAGLSIFDQGFYDKLGFGTGGYEHWFHFDPAALKVSNPTRPPIRLTKDDWERVHQARLEARRGHGGCVLHPAGVTRADMSWEKNAFGLGFEAEDGTLTHFLWGKPSSDAEHGPYDIWWLVYRNGEQLLELLSLIKSWGDQVHTVRMDEPPDIQLQDLLKQPFRARRVRREGKHRVETTAAAYFQWRMLDVRACMARVQARREVRFNLHLHDPITKYLPDDTPWQGTGGRYVVNLGAESHIEAGEEPALPVVEASVGAWTRWWLGVRPATSLALTDDLHASPEMLATLDACLQLPQPHPRWEF